MGEYESMENKAHYWATLLRTSDNQTEEEIAVLKIHSMSINMWTTDHELTKDLFITSFKVIWYSMGNAVKHSASYNPYIIIEYTKNTQNRQSHVVRAKEKKDCFLVAW